MSRFVAAAAAILLLSMAAKSALAGCYDLTKDEPHELSGRLSYRIFPGPPGFQDVEKGDTPEPGYLLKLPSPVCLQGDDFADPANMFDEVQLVETDATAGQLAKFRERQVTVKLERPMAAQTGHHHRPLVAWVSGISPAGDITEEYGTAASTVRAFYYALAAGDGDTAAGFIVPEKRVSGPLSGHALSRFYGGLREPLQLVDVKPDGGNRYKVRYTFQSASGRCDGAAIVTITTRHGANLIKAIKALNGC